MIVDRPSRASESAARVAVMAVCVFVIVLLVGGLAWSQHELYVRCRAVGGEVVTIGRGRVCSTRDGRLVPRERLEGKR